MSRQNGYRGYSNMYQFPYLSTPDQTFTVPNEVTLPWETTAISRATVAILERFRTKCDWQRTFRLLALWGTLGTYSLAAATPKVNQEGCLERMSCLSQ